MESLYLSLAVAPRAQPQTAVLIGLLPVLLEGGEDHWSSVETRLFTLGGWHTAACGSSQESVVQRQGVSGLLLTELLPLLAPPSSS